MLFMLLNIDNYAA